jgi:hypothetical protein
MVRPADLAARLCAGLVLPKGHAVDEVGLAAFDPQCAAVTGLIVFV